MGMVVLHGNCDVARHAGKVIGSQSMNRTLSAHMYPWQSFCSH